MILPNTKSISINQVITQIFHIDTWIPILETLFIFVDNKEQFLKIVSWLLGQNEAIMMIDYSPESSVFVIFWGTMSVFPSEN